MRALVTYGSSRGSTSTIARWLADWLGAVGIQTDVLPAGQVPGVEPYDAVIVGGALYSGAWHPDARQFVTHHAPMLRERAVWLFSSGPLDDSALRQDIPPTPDVAKLLRLVNGRGHRTFGGRLDPDARGFVAHQMARRRAGDWRSPVRVQRWAMEIARAMKELPESLHGPGNLPAS